ncbi:PdcA protein [Escherichia coli]|nr:PdcA protein [Escherichia coli]ROL05874.1 PdcA protein [Escherichia coli]
MARKYNKLSREALKMLLDGVGARTAIAVLCRQEMVVLKQRMPGSR